MGEIIWPQRFTPGLTDNFVSNKIIVAGLSVAEIWPYINDTSGRPNYYSNASDIHFKDGSGPGLRQGSRFRFTTFGLPIEAEVTEYKPPSADTPARLAWHGWVNGPPKAALDVHHAWLFEDLPGGRVRILTQESQIGKPAQDMARTRPNPMLNGHQEWIDGLADAARKGSRL